MDILELGKLSGIAFLQVLVGGILIWLFRVYLPQLHKLHNDALSNLVLNFKDVLTDERTIHKTIQSESAKRAQAIEQQFSTFEISVDRRLLELNQTIQRMLIMFVAQRTSETAEADEMFQRVLDLEKKLNGGK
jgi:hypothetical protein